MGMDTQDYARLQLALASLGESFINRYPNSGGYQTTQNAKDVAQSTIASEEAKKQQKKAEKKAKKSAIGGIVGTAVPMALAPFTGGTSLMFAGLGGQAGSALMGGTPDPGALANSIDPAMFGAQKQQDPYAGMDINAMYPTPNMPGNTAPIAPYPGTPAIVPMPLSLSYGANTPYEWR